MAPRINGDVHLVLVVKDAKRSAHWYARVFGFVVAREELEVVLPDASGRRTAFTSTSLFHVSTRFFLGLAQPHDPAVVPFGWGHAGLQHLGFHVDERSELDEWSRHLDRLGVEHSPVLPEGPGLLVRFHDPDEIPVEVFWVDRQDAEQRFIALARLRARAARERRKQVRPS